MAQLNRRTRSNRNIIQSGKGEDGPDSSFAPEQQQQGEKQEESESNSGLRRLSLLAPWQRSAPFFQPAAAAAFAAEDNNDGDSNNKEDLIEGTIKMDPRRASLPRDKLGDVAIPTALLIQWMEEESSKFGGKPLSLGSLSGAFSDPEEGNDMLSQQQEQPSRGNNNSQKKATMNRMESHVEEGDDKDFNNINHSEEINNRETTTLLDDSSTSSHTTNNGQLVERGELDGSRKRGKPRQKIHSLVASKVRSIRWPKRRQGLGGTGRWMKNKEKSKKLEYSMHDSTGSVSSDIWE